jgi:hypothetical protein
LKRVLVAAGWGVVERVRVGEIGSMELLDVDECFGGCHLNCRSSDTSVYALRMICQTNVPWE